MNTKDFLDLVLPSEASGIRIIGTLKNGSKFFSHTVHETNQEAADKVAEIADTTNTYYALGSFKQGFYVGSNGKKQLRTQENVSALKSFWMDFDVKPDAPEGDINSYPTTQEAADELKRLLAEANLPKPMIVASGPLGLHVYWIMEDDMAPEVWQPIASKLKGIAQHLNVRIDPSVTADSARVLRPVGSFNTKALPATEVTALTKPRIYNNADFYTLVEDAANKFGISIHVPKAKVVTGLQIPGAAPAAAVQAMKEMKSNVNPHGDLPVSLTKVVSQCALIRRTYETNGANDDEPIWYACMGLATYTDDVEGSSEVMSSAGRGYTLEASLLKGQQWRTKLTGAPTCQHLQDKYASDCKECPHKGKIGSPVSLGRYVVEAEQPVIDSEELGLKGFVIPNPPKPFKRSVDKGIYYDMEDASGAVTPMQICPFDMYPVRVQECERKDERNVVWRTDLPHSGIKDILIPFRTHAKEGTTLMAELFAKGVTVQPKNTKVMQEFMVGYITQLQREAPASVQFAKLGWRDDGTYVCPTGLCTRDGFIEFPAIQSFQREIQGLTSKSGKVEVKGTLDGWKQCLQFFNAPKKGDKRYLRHQLVALFSMASPLLAFTNVKGVHVNFVGESGSGKSSAQFVANALWGHPVAHGVNGGQKMGATLNSLFRRISLGNNNGLNIDEVTTWDGAYFSEFAYNISQGTGRMRMNSGESFAAFETWQCITTSSSNQSGINKIGAHKADAQAEMNRILEFTVDKAGVHSKTEADAMLRMLNENYGIAGPHIMQFIVENQEAIRNKMYAMMAKIDLEANIDSQERFASSGIAAVIVWAQILERLGLITWDLPAIYDECLLILDSSREKHKAANSVQGGGLYSTMINGSMNETLIVASMANAGLTKATVQPINLPRSGVGIHKDITTQKSWVAVSLIRKWCNEHGVDVKLMAQELITKGALTQASMQARKVLGADTIYAAGQVRCWEVDDTKL